jgi:NarL family two-component system response regulator LiaR
MAFRPPEIKKGIFSGAYPGVDQLLGGSYGGLGDLPGNRISDEDTSSEELLQAIRDTYRNQPVLGPEIARKLMEELQGGESRAGSVTSLTDREVEILQQMALGLTNQEIADVLVLSERTVRTHVTNILAKLGLSNRTQAVLYALRAGIAHIDYRKEE